MVLPSRPEAPRSLQPRAPFPESPLWTWLLFACIFAGITWLTLSYELEPLSATYASQPLTWIDAQRDTALLLGLLCGAGGIGGFALLRWRKLDERRWIQRALAFVLMALTGCSGIIYFYGANGARRTYPHVHDAYHYVLGSKYFDELGYDLLYVCTLQAMGPRAIPDDTRVRDLSTDAHVKARELRSRADCQSLFSEQRWAEFKADLKTFGAIDRRTLRKALGDRGYNGSPFHTFIAGTLAKRLPLDYQTLSLMPLIDVFSICVMLGALCHAFGHRLGLLCALFFFCQFVDRFMIIGGSFLRYQWLAALGLAIAFLKRERFASAGAALAVSSALNVFPVLFSLGMLVRGALAWRGREPLSVYRRFFAGALGAGLVCLALGACHADGLKNYGSFAEAMRVHNAAGRAPGFGVGIKYNFVSSSFASGHSGKVRTQELRSARPLIIAAAALIMLAILLLLPALDATEGAVLAGFGGTFCIFGPTGYYFAFAFLLLLLWHRRLRDGGGMAMVALAFLSCMPPYLAILDGAQRFYAFNRMMSASWTVYLVLTLSLLYRCYVAGPRAPLLHRAADHRGCP